jgi:cholesterol transport system auxiliary component
MRHLLLLALTSCALTRNSPPVTIHYYDPPLATEARTASDDKPKVRVRLGRIETSAHLRYSIAYRLSNVQLEVYDFDRWTDTPDAYVDRSLEHALFAARPIEEATGGDVVVLDVDVLAFEEQRGTPASGLVQLRYRLRDDYTVIASGTITVVRKARSAELSDVVAAIGSALDEASGRIADRVLDAAVAHPVHPEDPDDVPRRSITTRR